MEPIRVLVIDDSEDFRYLAAKAARSDGRIVIVGEANQGVEGIRLASELQPDLVLLDLHMPMMDGLEAIEGIRSLSPGSKILAWSSFDDSFGEDAVALGADDHVSKDLALPALLTCVVDLIHRENVATKVQEPVGTEWVGPYVLRSLTS